MPFDFDTSILDNYSPKRLRFETEKPAAKEEEGGLGGDLVASFGSGAGEFVQGVGELLGGKGSFVAELGSDAVKYWNAEKSAKLTAKEAALAKSMASDEVGALDIAGQVLKDPYLMASMVSSSAPAMATGMGLSGLIGKAMAAAGLMTESTGALTAWGSRWAAGAGEGAAMVPDVYKATEGDPTASAAALALGVVTNLVTPGNVGVSAVRRMTGAPESAVESALNKTLARRLGTTTLSEAAQEYGQEGGQALIEQFGRDEDFNLGEAAKKAAVGAVLGGVMGASLHPIVGDGAPVKPLAEQAAEQVAVREEALAQDPNNPVLQAELANARAVEQHLANPSEATELQVAATVANLEAARNPDSRELADQADMATAAVALNTAGAEGTREAARTAANVTSDAIAASPDLDTALTTFGAGERASSTLQTTAKGIENTVKGVEVSHTHSREGENAAEVITPEQEQKLEIQALRARNMELKNQRLAEEIERARAKPQGAKEEVSAAPAPVGQLQYEALPGENGEWHVVDSNMDTYDTYSGPMAQQDAEAAAAALSQPRDAELRAQQVQLSPIPDEIQVEEREMTATEADAVALAPEEARYREAADQLLAAGYSAEAAEQIRTTAEGASNAELRTMMNDVASSPERRRVAHALLRTRGVQTMTDAQFDAREDALERGLTEALEGSSVSRGSALSSLASRDESYIRDIAGGRNRVVPRNQLALARAALAFRQGRHMGEIDAAPLSRESTLLAQPTTLQRESVANAVRQVAAEVEAEAVRPQTGVGRQIVSNFEQRADAAMRNGTLTKLGSFWKRLMSKPNQRSLAPIDTSDLNAQAREAVRSGRAIPMGVLNEVADRYNAALKENAREWAEANNQVFNEAEWEDPITNVSQSGVGRNAGFAIYVKGLGRRGRNPFMPVPNQRPAYFSADTGIHASSLEDAPGSADLAYRFAAQIADIRGKGWRSDTILSTVNNLRRQLQSASADTLFGAGVIHPLTSEGHMGPQGMPSRIWNQATEVQRIGLNALRAAHSVSEVRGMANHIPTGGRFTENLVFDRQGRIKAVSDPLTPNGFPRGTIVTDDMLEAKVGTVDPVTGFMPRATQSSGRGGVGADTARLAILNNTILAAIENDPEARIPSWIGRMAQEQGERMGGWFFSESGQAQPTVAAPISREAAVSRIKALLGDDLGQLLIDSKLVGFVNDEAELAGETFFEAEGRVQGATTPDGRILLVLGNLTEDSFDGVLQHEASHATLKALLGEETYGQLMGKLDTLLQAGGDAQWVRDADARIPENTPASVRTQEIAAYAIEQAANGAPDTNPLIRWAKDLLSSLRAAIIQSKRVPEALRLWAMKHIQPQDLAKLAIAGLRAQASQASSMQNGDGVRMSGVFINTPAFKRWFGDSKVVDENGKPLRVYHGTAADVSFFDKLSLGESSRAYSAKKAFFFTTSPKVASGYAILSPSRPVLRNAIFKRASESPILSPELQQMLAEKSREFSNEDLANSGIVGRLSDGATSGANVIPVYLSLQNPLIVDYKGEEYREQSFGELLNQARSEGRDGVIFRNAEDSMHKNFAEMSDIYAVFEPTQIKSATSNSGEFDPTNPDIRSSIGLRTSAEYQQEINELMAEHGAEETTGPRRAEINAKVARLRTAWRMAEESEYEQARLSTAPVDEGVAPAKQLNVLDNERRKPFQRLLEKFQEIFQQKHVRLERLLREAGVTMENIRMDTIGALDRLGSKLMTIQKDLVMKPMARIENVLVQAGFENGGVAREQMDEFLKNRHAPEYNRHIAEINPASYEMRDGVRTHVSGFDEEHPGSGIMTKDAEAAVADVFRRAEDGDKQAKAILEAEKAYRQMIEDLQDYAVAQGLEKQETIDAWREKFKNYTPFNRELNLVENLSIGSVPGSQGFSLRSGISRRAMGSGADIVSPLASSILLGLKTTTRGENAEVARTVLNFARTFTPKFMDQAGNMVPMWKVETIPNQRVLKKMNVYQVRMADGSMSPEFYNRQQATAYANNEQAAWVRANPNEPVGASGIEVQQVGDGPQNRVVVMPVPNVLNRNNVMVIPEDGENKIIVFNEQSEDAMKILSALKSNGGSNDINKWLLGPRMFARWVVATSTGYNPAFMFFNAARDIQGAMLSINADKVPGWKASDSLQLAKDFVPAMREIWRQERKEFKALHSNTGPAAEPTQGSFAWYAKKMQEHGGATGVASSIYDIESAETQLRRLYGQEKLNTMTRAAEAVDWLSRFNTAVINMGDKFARFGEGETDSPLMGWVSKHLVSEVSRMNSATELATRTLAFKGAFDKFKAAGKSEEEAFKLAANISKNISTNFNRRGMASGLINQLYPFFNAALQGSARLAEVMFEKETYTVDKEGVPMLDQRTKLTPFGKIVLYSLPALGGVQAALLAMAGYDDEDVPAQIKDRAFVVPIWDGKYVAIPMPHGFNTIINFGREMTDALLNPKEAMQHIGRATLGQVGAFNPFGSAGNWVTDMLPAIFDAPVSLYMNKDAFGRPIAKEAPDSANPTPGFTRAKGGASKTGRVISEAINTITGGNEDQSGFVSPTPDQIDFVLGQFTGGVGREVAKVGGLAVAGAKDLAGVEREQIPLYKLPLAGRLIGSVSEPAALHGKLFEVRSKINDKYARYKGLMERGQTEEANAFWDANPELALRGSVESFARKDSKQRKARALARNSGEVGEVNRISAEQDEKLAALLAEIDAIRRSAK